MKQSNYWTTAVITTVTLVIITVGIVQWQSAAAGAEAASLSAAVTCGDESFELLLTGTEWPSGVTAFYLNEALLTAVNDWSTAPQASWTISPIPAGIQAVTVTTGDVSEMVVLEADCLDDVTITEVYLPLVANNATGLVETAVSGSSVIIEEIGSLSSSNLGFETVTNNVHMWNIDLEKDEVVTFSLVTENAANGTLAVQTPSGIIGVERINNGAVEMLQFTAEAEGSYQLFVTTTTLATSDYIVNFNVQGNTPTYIFKGEPVTDMSIEAVVLADKDDIWTFYATAGEIVSLRVTPGQNESDLLITLFSKNGEEAASDEIELGATEEILDFMIPENGLYALRIGDWDFLERPYTLTFERK